MWRHGRAIYEANPKTETNARGIPEPPNTSAYVRRYFYRTRKKRPLLEHIPTTLEAYDG